MSAKESSLAFGGGFGLFRPAGDEEQSLLRGHNFLLKLGSALEQAGLPVESSRLVKGALGELIDNISEHAGPLPEGFSAFEIQGNIACLTVADAGQGIVKGYKTGAIGETVESAELALQWAVVDHRSRSGDTARGTGFATVLRAIRSLDAALRVRSDNASLEIEGAAGSGVWTIREQAKLQGFVVTLRFGW